MVITVSVAGFPPTALKNKIIMKLKRRFRTYGIDHFWVRELVETKSGGKTIQSGKIDFNNFMDADKAAHRLNGAEIVFQGQIYFLAAHLNEGSERSDKSRRSRPQEQRRRERSDRQDDNYERSRYRSRSPLDSYRLSSRSNVDIEIELLRKQREIIEEERRLLLERKKLDLVREYGPSASQDLAMYDDHERDYRRRDREERYRRPSSAPRKPARPPLQPTRRSPTPPQSILLPSFFLPCKRLLKEMKPLMKGLSPSTIRILIPLLKSTIRRRIAVMLDGKPHVNSAMILQMYRKLYSTRSDDDLVKTQLNRMGVSPEELQERNARRNAKQGQNKESEPSSPILTAGEQEELVMDHGLSPEKETDTDVELKDEIAISLDATDIEESLDWTEGGTDWN